MKTHSSEFNRSESANANAGKFRIRCVQIAQVASTGTRIWVFGLQLFFLPPTLPSEIGTHTHTPHTHGTHPPPHTHTGLGCTWGALSPSSPRQSTASPRWNYSKTLSCGRGRQTGQARLTTSLQRPLSWGMTEVSLHRGRRSAGGPTPLQVHLLWENELLLVTTHLTLPARASSFSRHRYEVGRSTLTRSHPSERTHPRRLAPPAPALMCYFKVHNLSSSSPCWSPRLPF